MVIVNCLFAQAAQGGKTRNSQKREFQGSIRGRRHQVAWVRDRSDKRRQRLSGWSSSYASQQYRVVFGFQLTMRPYNPQTTFSVDLVPVRGGTPRKRVNSSSLPFCESSFYAFFVFRVSLRVNPDGSSQTSCRIVKLFLAPSGVRTASRECFRRRTVPSHLLYGTISQPSKKGVLPLWSVTCHYRPAFEIAWSSAKADKERAGSS